MQSLQVEKKDIKGERKIKETQREREKREAIRVSKVSPFQILE